MVRQQDAGAADGEVTLGGTNGTLISDGAVCARVGPQDGTGFSTTASAGLLASSRSSSWRPPRRRHLWRRMAPGRRATTAALRGGRCALRRAGSPSRAASWRTDRARRASISTIRPADAGRAFPTCRSASTTRWPPPAEVVCTSLGGYADGEPQRLSCWDGRRWRRLPPLPEARAAGGAAFAGGKLYVVGGVGRCPDARRASRSSTTPEPALVADPRPDSARAPRRRRRSAVVSTRSADARPGSTRTSTCSRSTDPPSAAGGGCPDVPTPRGGTALAAVAGRLVSVGGEEPAGTIASVFAYDRVRAPLDAAGRSGDAAPRPRRRRPRAPSSPSAAAPSRVCR